MRVKIELGPNQTRDEGEEALYKALSSTRDGSAHDKDVFLDAAMQDQADEMKHAYNTILDSMLKEITQVLDETE
jgi:hypothetical protein